MSYIDICPLRDGERSALAAAVTVMLQVWRCCLKLHDQENILQTFVK